MAAKKKRRWLLGTVIALAVIALGGYLVTRRAPLVTAPDAPPETVLIRNVRVIDVVAGSARDGMDVSIRGDVIRAIEPHDPSRTAALVIDGAGASLIPGLIDVHAHLDGSSGPPWRFALPDADLNLEQMLYCGVTRVLDPGAMAPAIFELREEVNAARRLGPAMYAAGPILTAKGGHPIPLIRKFAPGFVADMVIDDMVCEIESEAQASEVVAALAAWKPDVIKIAIDNIPGESPRLQAAIAAAIVASAREHEKRVVAHIGSTTDALEAGAAGVAAWIHGVYQERIDDDDIAKLAAFGIPMAPTLIGFHSYSYLGQGDYPTTKLEREVATSSALDARIHAPEDFDWGTFKTFSDALIAQRDTMIDNVRRLAAAGVVILAGSDAQGSNIHGASLHGELALLTRAGLSPIDVLRAATINNARFLSNSDDPAFGVIDIDKRADLVIVDGDPLADPSAISAIRAVIAGGVPLERHALDD